MPVYPVIYGPMGQLTVIDGFVVKLTTQKNDERNGSETQNPDTIQKIRALQSAFQCESLRRLQHVSSNFIVTNNSMLFKVVTEKEYIMFVNSKGRFYCRKIHHSKATHVAIAIQMARKRGQRTSKYVVYGKPLNIHSVETSLLLKQQEKDLENYRRESPGNLPTPEIKHEEVKFKIKVITEEELMKLSKISPTTIAKDNSPRYTNHVRHSLAHFKETLFQYCLQRSLIKLEKMIKVLLEFPNLAQHSAKITTLHKECQILTQHNVSLAHDRLFDSCFESVTNQPSGSIKSSSRGTSVDRCEVLPKHTINSEQQLAQDTGGTRRRGAGRLSAKKREPRPITKQLKSHLEDSSELLVDKMQEASSKNFNTSQGDERAAIEADDMLVKIQDPMSHHCPKINHSLAGHDLPVFSKLKALEQIRFSSKGREPSTEQLIRRIQIFCGYPEQRLLYVENFDLLVRKATASFDKN